MSRSILDDRMPMIPKYRVTARVSIMAETVDYNHRLMNVPAMWKHTKGEGVKVVVLDTGCPQHVDLKQVGSDGFITGLDKYDQNGHGTHVAGIIAAIANNGMGVAGIAPECEDYYGRVLDAEGSGSIGDIIKGIMWAVDVVGAQVINMSLGIPAGVPRIKELEDACNYARNKGVTVVCAAGNEGWKVGQPAMYDSVLAIAAVDDKQQHASFSNMGPEVDFATGGVNVFSTYLNNGYVKLSGTSMASPALTGIVALIIADEKKDNNRWLTPDEVYAKLKKISYDIGPAGYDETYGNGIPVFVNGDNPSPQPDPQPPVEEPGNSPCKLGLPMARVFVNAAVMEMDRCAIATIEQGGRAERGFEAGLRAMQEFVSKVDGKAGRK